MDPGTESMESVIKTYGYPYGGGEKKQKKKKKLLGQKFCACIFILYAQCTPFPLQRDAACRWIRML